MKMTLGARFGTCFAVTLLASALLSLMAYQRLSRIGEGAVNQTVNSEQMYDAARIQTLALQTDGRAKEHVLDSGDDEKAELDKEIRDAAREGDRLIDEWSSTDMDSDERALFNEMVTRRNAWIEGLKPMLAASHAHKTQQAMDVFRNQTDPAFDSFLEDADKLVKMNKDQTDQSVAEMIQVAGGARGRLVVGVVISFLIAGIVVQVILSTNKLLRGLVQTMTQYTSHLSDSAAEVTTSSQYLAQGASEQAASLEETSSSLEEVSSMTRRNAEMAQQASVFSTEANSVAIKGNNAMVRMSAAIGARSSRPLMRSRFRRICWR
jgi:methyl-accepting chemotaxis protein